MPRTLKIFGTTYRICFSNNGTKKTNRILLNPKLSKEEQLRQLFEKVTQIIVDEYGLKFSASQLNLLKKAVMAFISDNIFSVDWSHQAILELSPLPKVRTSTVLQSVGSDIKIIKRTGN